MAEYNYSDPVARLLTIGDPENSSLLGWPDYPAQYGLSTSDVPELIRMATEEELNQEMSDSTKVWAPLHAWRALGQLRAEEAIRPLLTLLHRVDDDKDDWVAEDLPKAFAMIGPAAIPPLSAYLADPDNKLWARVAAGVALREIGNKHAQAREACITALSATLEKYETHDDILNGELVAFLADLDAVEAAPLVERAFKSGRVDEMVMGDWEDFQIALGLLDERITEPNNFFDFGPILTHGDLPSSKPSVGKVTKKGKNKRKQAKESRKKNRKKK